MLTTTSATAAAYWPPVDARLPRAPSTARLDRTIPSLDGVRAFAVISVMMLHFATLLPAGSAIARVSAIGWMGVDVFFVLSGFLITRILLATAGRRGYFRSFYVRRFLRIFPLYYAVLGVIALLPLVAPALLRQPDVFAAARLPEWTYLTNIAIAWPRWGRIPAATAQFWSLAVEEQFYVVWPIIVLLARRRLGTVAVAVCFGAWALRIVLPLAGVGPHAIYVLTFTRADGLALGALVAVLAQGQLARCVRPAAMAGAISLVGLLTIWIVSGADQFGYPMQALGFACVTIGSASAIVLLLTHETHRISRFLATPLLGYIGRRSYALYVLHPIAEKLITRFSASPWAAYCAGLALSFLAAELSWQFWERHWLSLKRFAPYPSAARDAERAHSVP